ncbi:pentatricopeptide repeat-containing protein At4g35130, chloroplastic-like [Benincasa hispida]|uniref:pentatricopeptide repeat-containing protein At4g35130, chloroplastic-like n=1 Tax=Benincasa hispida TaxID=102211 RepID=UPI0019028B91|nr:pentatricopeptide repeat-containing protein At4g35130, chloroplastic-like [Benincasa hispida]
MLWNSIIKSHFDSGLFLSALLLYKNMREVGVEHDGFTFPILNHVIMSIWVDVLYAEMVHCVGIRMGFIADLYFCNTMMEVYGKCGCLVYARHMFDEMPNRDLVSWTSMISAYVNGGDVVCALDLFEAMRRELEPNSVTAMVMLQACCATQNFVLGRQLQCHVVKNGLLLDIGLRNSFLRMYSRLGGEDEVGVFFSEIDCKNVVSWNILMSFYSSVGNILKVVDIFNKIMGEVTLSIETLTILISATATSDSGCLILGENLHSLAIKSGLYDSILQTSLLDMYAKFGELENSAKLFKEIPNRSIITWGAMMSSFIQNGHFDEAVEIFKQMQAAGLKPSVGVLKHLIDAYAYLGALQLGKAIHCYLIRIYGLEICNTHLETSLLNMYGRCGSIASARKCFDLILTKDVVVWTSMIDVYGAHGLGIDALNLFHQMMSEEVAPNSVTFLSLLSACSHSGLVSEGCEIFYSMRSSFDIKPDLEHYTCFVDLLSRSTRVREAFAIILRMTNLRDGRIWGALMGACRVYGDNKIANYAAHRLLELEPDNVGYYTLLSNAQASVGQWHEVEKLRSVVYEKDLVKKPGWSFIELNGTIHGFVSGDRSHNKTNEIYDLLVYINRIK